MQPGTSAKRGRLSKRTVVASILIIVVIPLLIAFGILYLKDRSYYLISVLIIACTMIPFFKVFEKRKPQARELVVIAVLCAIAVAGRAAFFWLPQFKPVTAIVIIAGVCFGAESGFLVGAVTGFVSNFFMGQGPWTPWQMFCFGIIGFLAGILFKKGFLQKKILPLCVYGGLSTFFIYGGIINISSLTMFGSSITWQTLMMVYASAIPFDAIHAASTVVFLLLFARPMMEKLDRIKIKYGMIEP